MKVIKTAAMVVGAVALVASGVGAVVGAGAFVAATGVSLATVTAIGTVAGLVSTVANVVSPPKAAKGTIGGSQTEFKLDPNAGIPYHIGRTFNGGNIVHRDTWGTDNQYQGFAVTYSGAGTLQSFEAYLVDQTNYGRNGDRVGGTYDGWMWNRLTLPATPAGPLTSPVAGFPGFDNDFRMSGHATGVVVVKFDTKNGKKFTGGVPKNGVVAVGERVYDPRQDSTYPGGNGPCRATDEATYVGGAAALNPWLHALTWAIGRWQNGKRVLGVGMRVRSIDVASFVDAANVADANGWTIGGVVYSIDNKWEVLRQMSQAGGGSCIRTGARLTAFVNAPKVALATVRDADLVGKASVAAAQTYRDRLNGMIPKFRSEAHGWEMVPASPVRVASYVALDGEEKTREWPLPLVQNVKQAGELVAYELVNRREFGPIQLPLFIRFMGYKPGDALNISIDKLDMVNQLAVVRKRQIDAGSGNVQLSLVSETTAKHAYALGHTSVAPDVPSLTAPDDDILASPQASDWTALGGELENAGVKTPAIILTGTVRNPNAEAFLVELRPVASADWKSIGSYPAKTERVDITQVAAGADYVVGVSFIRRGVIGERLQLDPVRAGMSVVGEASNISPGGTIGGVYNPDTGQYEGGVPIEGIADKLEDVRAVLAEYDQTIADVDARVRDADKRIADFASEVDGKLSDASDLLDAEIARAKGEEETINQRIDTISAGSGYDDTALRTLIQDVDTARADDARTLGQRLSTLKSTVTRGGGNRVPNTDFVTLDGWTFSANLLPGGLLAKNASGPDWQPGGENTIGLRSTVPSDNPTGYVEAVSEFFAVTPGSFVQFYADVASHRAPAWVTLFFVDAFDQPKGYAGENTADPRRAGGRDPANWTRTGKKSFQVPAGAVRAQFVIRKYDTDAGELDSFAWFWRPYVGDALDGQEEWNPFVAGTNGIVQTASLALIESNRKTLADADTAIAERVETTEAQLRGDDESALLARIKDTETAVTDGRFAAAQRVTDLEASSGGGGNLLSNTDWAVDTAGWVFTPEDGSTGYRAGYGPANYWPEGMPPLQIYSSNGSGNRAGHWSQIVRGIEGGSPYQASLYVGNHRATAGLYIDCVRANGEYAGATFTAYTGKFNGGTRNLKDDYERIVLNFTPPADTAYIHVYLLKNGTLPGFDDSYTWFLRPQVCKVRAGVTAAVPYTPGSGDQGQAALTARISTVERVASDGRTALASRATALEAGTAGARASLNPNPEFSAWSDPNTTPDRWGYWNAVDKVVQIANPLGRGGYGVKQIPTDANSGMVNGDIYVPNGKYFMEVTAYKASGSWRGAGVTLSGQQGIDFAATPDTAGKAGDREETVRSWSVPFEVRDDYIGSGFKNWHCMSNWTGFSPDLVAKEIWWLECRLRRASSAEGDVPAISARVKTAEDAIADAPNRYASAKRATDLEAQVNGGADSNLLARANASAAAIADGKVGAVSERVDRLDASYNGRIASVEEKAGAIADIDGRTSIFWGVTGQTPDGKVGIGLFKKDGSPGQFIVNANMLVDGNIVATGSIKSLSFDAETMGRSGDASWTGQVEGTVGGANIPFSLTLPSIYPRGRFLIEATIAMQTDAGQTTITNNYQGTGKQLRVTRVAAGGGLYLRCSDNEANVYQVYAGFQSLPIRAATKFNANFVASISKANYDTGVTDQGDFYQRLIAASYTVTSIALKATWIAT